MSDPDKTPTDPSPAAVSQTQRSTDAQAAFLAELVSREKRADLLALAEQQMSAVPDGN